MSDLYELPKGWDWKTFKELFTITSSKRVHKKDWLSEGVPFYRAREIVKLSKNGFVDNELFISDEMYNSFIEKYGIPNKDDILVTGVGTIGIPYIVRENDKFYFKDGNIIWLKNISNTNSKFIEYSFQSEFIKNQINSGSGSTVKTYTITNANNTVIPLPPLSEQQRIVSKLDKLFEKIDKAIALHQKNMDEADVFMGSVLNDVFGELEEKYEKDSIGNMIALLTDYHANGSYKILKENVELLAEKNYALMIRATDLVKEDYEVNVKYISKSAYDFLSKTKVYGGEIILPKIGTIGSVYFMPYLDRPTSLAMNLFMLRCLDNVDNKYLFSYLKSPKGYEDILSRAKGAVTKTITKDAVRSIELPLPPLNIQQKVITYLDNISEKIEKVKSVQKEKMGSLKALKASILDNAFRGEL